ncbi:MAG: hypothetical protein KC713_04575, partial [Candidatus Omnitrophica bacterium]|nr:hypothetical protein [Candidatus Omnitrophota bacterium]
MKTAVFKQTFFVCLLTLTLCACADIWHPKRLLLDSFEGEISKQSVDFGASKGSSIVVTNSEDFAQCQKQSLHIVYDLKPDGYMYCSRGEGLVASISGWRRASQDIAWDRYAGFEFKIFGAKNGDIAFDVKDAQGELFRFMFSDGAV